MLWSFDRAPAGAFRTALADPMAKRHPSRTRVYAYVRACAANKLY